MVKVKGFQHKELECPGPLFGDTLKEIINHIESTGKPPSPCDECYTVVLYPAKASTQNFNQLLSSEFGSLVEEDKKYERAYVRSKGKEHKDNLIQDLNQMFRRYGVVGRVEWRRCCKRLERKAPHLFKDPKTFAKGYQKRLESYF